jgi:hypothetical protein
MDETIESIEILAPFLPREQVIELCSGRKALQAWRDAKLNLYRQRMAHAYRMQNHIAAAQAGREMRFVDGPGRHRLSIDPVLHRAAELRYGDGCWQDKHFRSRVERDHPEMRVPCPSRRLHPVNGFRDTVAARVSRAGDAADTAASTGNGSGPPKPNQTLFQLHEQGRL